MNDFATIDERHTLTLVRDLPGPIERVWAFLTDPQLFSLWFSDGVIADRVGGDVRFEMGADGTVTAYEPPHVLEYTWNERERSRGNIFDTLVRWELSAAGGRVRLTLTHKRLSQHEAILHSAGWHAFLDRFIAVVNGAEPTGAMELWAQLLPQYEQNHNLVDR